MGTYKENIKTYRNLYLWHEDCISIQQLLNFMEIAQQNHVHDSAADLRHRATWADRRWPGSLDLVNVGPIRGGMYRRHVKLSGSHGHKEDAVL